MIMNDQVARLFRRLTLLCLLGVGAIATLTYADLVNAKVATIAIAILALLLFVFDALADEPQELPETNPQVSQMLALEALAHQTRSSDQPTGSGTEEAAQIAQLLEANPQLLDLIQASGNQLYLLKLRNYLVGKIKADYERTGLVNLVSELQKVEAELDLLQINYDSLAVPERLHRLMDSFDRQKRVQAYCNVIDALPFIPFKAMIKVYLRVRLR